MLTITEIEAMTPEERRASLTNNCTELFGALWKGRFAAETGVLPKTVTQWMAGDPPVYAIRLADALAHNRMLERRIKAFYAGFAGLKEALDTLEAE